ncbi:hypothetical protein AHAS_Ahas06G0159200 [Arachis hypogaea]
MPEQLKEQSIPPIQYWTQLATSTEQLRSTVDQLKEEQKDQSWMLHKLTEMQESQGQELKELKS